jgi:Tfp pilus assembly protein PilO
MDRLETLQRILDEASAARAFELPEGEDLMPVLLERLARLQEAHRLELVALRPEPVQPVPLAGSEAERVRVTKLSVRVVLRGTYRDLGEYFSDLETLPILVAIRGLSLQRDDPRDRRIRAEFRIETYRVRVNDEEA